MKRAASLFVVVVVVMLAACAKESSPPAPLAPPLPTQMETETATPTAVTTPPPLEAVRAIYEGFVKVPRSFDRMPHFSRFYVEDNQRKDAACASGANLPACNGERFACLARAPSAAGSVISAKQNGEQPGKSASAQLVVQFGTQQAEFDVDLVYEDSAWKIDQVRCPPPPKPPAP